jgi:DNA gyrase/topoisomerase IV subunit B
LTAAAAAVILADVLFGSPTKDRLASPEVRPAVKEATLAALSEWAAANVRAR